MALLFALAAVGIPALHWANGAGSPSDQSMALYTDEGAGFSFQYPGSWSKEPYSSTMGNQVTPAAQVAFADPRGATYQQMGIDIIMVAVVEAPVEFTEAMRPTMSIGLGQYLARMQVDVPGFEVKTPVADCTIGGIRGVMAGFTALVGSQRIVAETYFLPLGYGQYQVFFQASEQNWDKNKPLFDAVLRSFRVIGDNLRYP